MYVYKYNDNVILISVNISITSYFYLQSRGAVQYRKGRGSIQKPRAVKKDRNVVPLIHCYNCR